MAAYAHHARRLGKTDEAVSAFIEEALFATVTNVNFDADKIEALIRRADAILAEARSRYEDVPVDRPAGPASFEAAPDREGLLAQGREVGVERRREKDGPDLTALRELVMYGLKGMAAYAYHALELGKNDERVMDFFHEALDFIARDASAEDLTAMALRVGEVNLRVMELLDDANTSTYGHPEPTRVRLEPRAGKAILVSGHDLLDLERLLEQTVDKGINIYTHGEMLPAHAYPGLTKYNHLAGHLGSAWQNQRREFDAFPGAILMTTNCIQKPRESYRARIFTTGPVAWPGVQHVSREDLSPVIEAAIGAEGFDKDVSGKEITVGFAHNAVLGVADQVIEAVKTGAIRHFFLVGGCDGAKSGRNYFTELVEKTPADTVILTLACGKFRFNRLELGDIGGIPRLLDMGQCNDAYSAVKVAQALADAFGTDVNGLPLSLVLSWYEQKAVCILLSLLHLGIRNIRLGPSLPAFATPALLDVLVKNFELRPIGDPEQDLADMLEDWPADHKRATPRNAACSETTSTRNNARALSGARPAKR
jgi:hydroxylamine reductase